MVYIITNYAMYHIHLVRLMVNWLIIDKMQCFAFCSIGMVKLTDYIALAQGQMPAGKMNGLAAFCLMFWQQSREHPCVGHGLSVGRKHYLNFIGIHSWLINSSTHFHGKGHILFCIWLHSLK